jgi:K+-transporting ATPase KdpF subunit
MTVGDCLLILLVVALLAYLLWALLVPERLG